MFLSPKHEHQFEIQTVNRKTYFPSRESNLIMSYRYIVNKNMSFLSKKWMEIQRRQKRMGGNTKV